MQQPAGLGGLAAGILDRLCLVEDDVVELDVAVPHDVAAERAVGGEHDIGIGKRHRALSPLVAGVVDDAEGRAELGRLLDPVEHEALGDDDEGGAVRHAAGRHDPAAPDEHGEDLDRLPEAHVVGETSPQAHPLEEREPAQPLALVLTQRPLEALRLGLGLGPFATGQFTADPIEGLVDVGVRLAGEQRVEEGHLDPAVPQPPIMLLRQRDHRLELGGKAVRQDAE